MQLRLTNFDKNGKEVLTVWDFLPLRDKAQNPFYLRDDRDGSNGAPNRRPFAEQKIRLITFGAGLLLQEDAKDNFLLFQRAHKIELAEIQKGQTVWIEYTPDINAQVDAQLLDEIDTLAWSEIKFIETSPRYYHSWAKT